ncbi:GAMYB transcription factor [Trema orientale]|uniref:GAMYB transcription factor n=1 Tax=Trema orientale TaxID=63057 RepID=A0A2P5EIH6_TREOI|nr:GAMYB transcription factor [Trema orientale]
MADSRRSSSDDNFAHSTEINREEPRNEVEVQFSEDEETLIIRMYNLVGERWSLIAGRIPGRTAEQIEKYWHSTCKSES